ncbi:MAG: D-tyrosyl-tRNA(Tyr) deacylase [Proteobacteria bacterium]|nr:MAG: D-tyrosyl-tRNA(Tyr) deacylase [Pseudomonadota bacterium]
MRALLQRVTEASVTVDDAVVGAIGRGLLVFLGVEEGDEEKDLDYLLRKIPALRVFSDREGKMNLAAKEAEASFLVVSQFTLIADTQKGNRPSFFRAAKPALADNFYQRFGEGLRAAGFEVANGRFGADMKVRLINDGPVTILLDTKEL